MDYPFDTDTTPYAYVSARHDTYSEPYGHLYLCLRLPALARAYPDDAVELKWSSQCSQPRDNSHDIEPFYALRFTAESHSSDGMTLRNMQRAAKEMQRVQRGITKIDTLAGSPAVLIEDVFMRTLRAVGVDYVYCDDGVNERRSIPDTRLHRLSSEYGAEGLRSSIQVAKRRLLTLCGHFKESSNA